MYRHPLIHANRITGAFMLILIACGGGSVPSAENRTFTNPVGDGILMGDPFVFQDGDQYYLYGTNTADGFKGFSSTDLVTWDSLGYVFRKDENTWGEARFWAPEVHQYRGQYYLAFSARKEGLPPGERSFRLCLAVADKPAGPFRELYAPWCDVGWSTIDAHLFIDDDGSPYVYFARVGVRLENGATLARIFGAPLKPDLSDLAADPVLCVEPDQPWENADSPKIRCNEGAFVFHEGRNYYMTYSANHYADPQYGIGYAVADAPLGPWVKSTTNPLVSLDPAIGVSGPGHNSFTSSSDGLELWMVYHAHADPEKPSGRRTVNIDRVTVEERKLIFHGPTRVPQPYPSGSR